MNSITKKPKLLQQLRVAIRYRHFSLSTEKTLRLATVRHKAGAVARMDVVASKNALLSTRQQLIIRQTHRISHQPSKIQYQQSLLQCRQTLYNALKGVENALSTRLALQEKQPQLRSVLRPSSADSSGAGVGQWFVDVLRSR